MAERYRTIICRGCGIELTEPPPRSGFPPERAPCPNCRSTAREYRVTGIAAAGAVAVSGAPNVSIEQGVAAGTYARTVVFSKTPDAWMAEIRKPNGEIVGVEVAFDAQDVFLLLDVHLLPPSAE